MAKKKSSTTKATHVLKTPIVAVMGHVDHGKTSLLDAIRGTRVTAKEEGGITQNTRAHQVTTAQGNTITFIDTPGHEAFSAMRSRGAEVTDFVLLVVAADDGIQPQTKESIEFAKNTNTPIILAINKIDIDGVKVDKVKKELSSFGVVIEEYGGEVMHFEVSATEETGIKELVEGIELFAEIQELKHTPPREDTLAEAYVLESNADKRLGAVALCILKSGELKERGAGTTEETTFKTRAYLDQDQKQISEVKEGDPFWVTGLKKTLKTGDIAYFTKDEKSARELQAAIIKDIEQEEEEAATEVQSGADLLTSLLFQKAAEDKGIEQKVLPIIVKASTQGTLEAVILQLEKMGDEEKTLKILRSETGEPSEDDIMLAKAAKGLIVTFQLPTANKIAGIAKREKVLVRNYEIIYEMIEELEGALEGMIEPEQDEVEVARARVKQVFTLTDGSIVAGCEVIKGNMIKGYNVFVERPRLSTKDETAEVGRGKITSLKIRKDEVKEVKKGSDCGIVIFPKPENLEEGDEVVAYKVE